MKIYDCFMYFDEDVVLDARLNILNQYVDKFVIVESVYSHSGKKRKLHFNPNKFSSFKKKIIYIVYDEIPVGVQNLTLDEQENNNIKIWNAIRFENGQRNEITKGLSNCNQNDLIIISDLDEIPNLENLKFNKFLFNIIIFKQRIFYYKFNLENKSMSWYGSRMCSFKNLKSPQWLRNIKPKNYPKWRLDTYFSDRKFNNLIIIENGGWHFTYIKDLGGIQHKLKNYLHHVEYDNHPMAIEDIQKIIDKKQVIYDHSLDQRVGNKFLTGKKLDTISLDSLPNYFLANKNKLTNWID